MSAVRFVIKRMMRAKARRAAFLLLLALFFPLAAESARTFSGTVTGKTGDRITIEFEDEWTPAAGDPVSITWELGGRTLDAGKAEVVSVEGSEIVAKVLEGKPNLKMQASIVSQHPLPRNLDPRGLFEHAMEQYGRDFESGQVSMNWMAVGNSFESLLPLFEQAADAGIAEAHYLIASYYYGLSLKDPWNRAETHDAEIRTHLISAAEGGLVNAQAELAKLYDLGWVVENDREKAEQWYLKAAEQGSSEAKYKASTFLIGKDARRSLQMLTEAAEDGHRGAIRILPGRLLDGEVDGVHDLEGAIKWYEIWAKAGDREPMIELGDLHFNGGDVSGSEETRLRELKKDERFPDLYRMMEKRLDSKRMPKDYAKAHEWYQRALASDHATKPHVAHHRLGLIYGTRDSGYFDPAKAIDHYTKSAEADLSYSKVFLARNYREGLLTPPDAQKAFQWASRAAEHGNVDGQVELALCYLEGVGCQVDYEQAKALLEKAVVRRNTRAFLSLGDMYRAGSGVPRDMQKAIESYTETTRTSGSIFVYDDDEAVKSAAHTRLAEIYLQDRPFETMEQSAAALELDPSNGKAFRCNALGMLHPSWAKRAEGEGYHALAVRQLHKAVEQGDAVSHFYLGECYRKGIGTKKDRQKAKDHYRLAAQAGIDKANDFL